jgi:signal transduction histidine kinase
MAATLAIDPAAARIAAACDGARRRLERDLHDGAQQRLVSLSLRLSLLATRVAPGSEVERLLGGAQEELAAALKELRDLAHGLHPAALTDHGLPAALTALAARATLPVDLGVDLGERPAEAVEVAAYYVVSECLANIAKYAHAERAAVTVAEESGELVVEVSDDGIGGASLAKGSGLQGLADRVGALGGRLAVESELGDGTVVEARIPLS